LQPGRYSLSDQGAVGAENRPQPQSPGIGHQLKYIIPQQRLTTAEDHDFKTGLGNLVQQLFGLSCIQFIFRLGPGIGKKKTVLSVHLPGWCIQKRSCRLTFGKLSFAGKPLAHFGK
jgi:hypothetical protein